MAEAIPPKPRRGILAAGNFIVDHVKVIDAFPEQDMLVNIVSETVSNGGGPYNVLKALSKLGAPFPLEAAGLVGDDSDGERIRSDCTAHGIDPSGLKSIDATTAYTDAMTVADTGRRTFFHHRGANARLAAADIDLERSDARIFYLGYLMLLDALDTPRFDGSTGSAELLASARAADFITAADLVSNAHPDYRERVLPALPEIDCLFLNEREAALLLGQETISSEEEAAQAVLELGVRRIVVLHTAQGATAVCANGEVAYCPALTVPTSTIAGSTGAGDAFSAGFLYALHEEAPIDQALRLGVAAAASSLRAPDPSSSIEPATKCLAQAEKQLAGKLRIQSPGGCRTT